MEFKTCKACKYLRSETEDDRRIICGKRGWSIYPKDDLFYNPNDRYSFKPLYLNNYKSIASALNCEHYEHNERHKLHVKGINIKEEEDNADITIYYGYSLGGSAVILLKHVFKTNILYRWALKVREEIDGVVLPL